MPPTIRAATPSDVPAVLPMVRAICDLHRAWDPDKYGFLPDIESRYARWLPQRAADPHSVFLVAEDGAEILGFIVAAVEDEIPIYVITQFGFIHDTWVQPAHRGKGIGRALVLGAVARFREMGIEQVRLDTAAANDAARHLFASCGFRASAMQMLSVISRA